MGRLNQEVVGAHYVDHVKFVSAVLRGNYPAAQQYWDDLAAIADPTQRMRAVYQFHFAMKGRGLYFLHAARAWLHEDPKSPAAHLLMGLSLSDAAMQARGAGYSGQASDVQYALFEQRFSAAQPHLEEAGRGDGPIAWAARAQLQLPYFYLGERDQGWAIIEYLIGQAPQYEWTYIWATEYGHAKWAGEDGAAALQKLSGLAAKNQLNSLGQKVLAQQIQYVGSNMENNPDPQAWRPYWQRRLADAPHLFNVLQLLGGELQTGNWPEVEALGTQAIALNPQQTYSFRARAYARKEMGRGDEALGDFLAAAMLGNDDAMANLIGAHVQGAMGVKRGDFDTLLAYCRLGTFVGLPSAANCVGSSYTEGFGGVTRDRTQAAAWHLLGARGGNSNSQHDVATILSQIDGDDSNLKISQFWMREAARQGHVYASRKAISERPAMRPIDMACAVIEAGGWTRLLRAIAGLLY